MMAESNLHRDEPLGKDEQGLDQRQSQKTFRVLPCVESQHHSSAQSMLGHFYDMLETE